MEDLTNFVNIMDTTAADFSIRTKRLVAQYNSQELIKLVRISVFTII